MGYRGEVLVAIMNNQHDMALTRYEGWYRIPVDNVQKRLKDRWPPRRLAFYQTKKFGPEAYAVNYYADVIGIRERSRPELFPDEPVIARESQRRRHHRVSCHCWASHPMFHPGGDARPEEGLCLIPTRTS